VTRRSWFDKLTTNECAPQKLHPQFIHLYCVGAALWADLVRLLAASLQSQTALAAENLFLRKQLALYRES
jgi:hypothetical protein